MSLSDFDEVPAFQLADGSSSTSDGWTLLMTRLKQAKQSAAASAIGMDAGQFSNVVAGKANLPLRQVVQLMHFLDLKLVDAHDKVIDQADFDGLARTAAMLLTKAPQLMLRG